MATYSFSEDPNGGVGMEVIARDYPDLFNAAVAALGLFMWDQETVKEREEIPLVGYGLNRSTAVIGLLSEILYRTEVDGWVFKRFVTQSFEEVDELDEEHRRKQWKVTGVGYGERHDPERHVPRFPVQAVLLPRLKVKEVEEGLRLYCILDA
ncbi:MAG: hypothetical protein Kow006_00210 [Gammaproteobacteria bacterium]